MGSALNRLLSLESVDDVDKTDHIDTLRLDAATERLQDQRKTVRVLDQRARELGIDQIKSNDDLVPLLFAHSTYKSYPESFVAKGQWNRLSMWLDTVSAARAQQVDMTGVGGIDEWLERLEAAGIFLVASSGTAGKNSFLPMNQQDIDLLERFLIRSFGFPYDVEPCQDMPFTFLGPSNAPMRFALSYKFLSKAYGRPGDIASLTDERMRLDDTMKAVALRKAMADGTATPTQVAAFEAESSSRGKGLNESMSALCEKVLGYRDEPQIIFGPLGTFWSMLEIARDQGVPDGTFHPETVVTIGGGKKGLALPDDFEEQINRFLGPVRRVKAYGMSELTVGLAMCDFGKYHHGSAHVTTLVLDETGEQLLSPGPDGRVEGRVAFYDAGWNSRWGGITTGDKATVDFSSHCECGRRGPVVEDPIVRYSELSAGGEDKLTCGGTIDAYIRGAVSEDT